MFNHFSYFMFSISILLSLASTSVYSVTCDYYEQSCGRYPNDWCCQNYQTCGTYTWSCYPRTTTTGTGPSSSIPLSVVLVVIILSFVCLVVCVWVAIRSRQQQQNSLSSVAPLNNQRVMQSYPIQRPVGLIHAQPVYNVNAISPMPIIYEAPPPPYEIATANLPPKYESAPVTAMVEQTNSWL